MVFLLSLKVLKQLLNCDEVTTTDVKVQEDV